MPNALQPPGSARGPRQRTQVREVGLKARRFYKPSTHGFERELAERYEAIQRQFADKPREPGD